MSRFIKENNLAKGFLDNGKLFLPNCSQPDFLKKFNIAYPAEGRSGRDPCGGGGGTPPPPTSIKIVQFDGSDIVTFGGDTLIQI